MTPVAKEAVSSRPSWSKIAASAYVPPEGKRMPTSPQQSVNTIPAQNKQAGHAAPRVPSPPEREIEAKSEASGPNLPEVSSTAMEDVKETDAPTGRPGILRRGESSTKAASNDDGSTQLSSDESAKVPSFDTKSVASGTTFALDEKESLRPDDSASMRAAVEEEDMFSAPSSVVAGSRVGSDLGSKPFREQLQDIPYIGSIPPRGALGTLYQSSAVATPASTTCLQQPTITPVVPLNNVALDGIQTNGTAGELAPDEKLMDALQSQRDRVWVLKLEQDIIDFVGQSKEATLTLPQCNAFYRMLAHKLADYYRLDHTVAQTATGSAVVISRTLFARIPPPLSGLPISSTVADTPPLIPTARKIMRRPGDPRSENTTAANSEGPSASVSEVGADGSSNEMSGSSKPKSQLTREEREKQYAEVRERIFGKSELAEGNETTTAIDDADNSRSSSANGKKKNGKKQRNLSNDDFEPRSQFPAYYPQTYPPNGYQADQYFYPQYPTVTPNQAYPMSPAGQAGMPYQQPYPSIVSQDGQTYAWSGQPPQPQHVNGNMPGFPQGGLPAGYDLSAHFQNAMQFQAQSNGGQMAGKGPASPMNSYLPPAMPISPQVMVGQWQQPSFDPTQGFNRQMYGPPNFQNPSAGPGAPYGYPQMSNYPANNLLQMQANYNRQQFNPQTQAFVPSGPGPRHMGIPNGPASYHQFAPHGQPQHFMRPNQSPNPSSSAAMNFGGSPQQGQAPPSYPSPSLVGQSNNRTTPPQDSRTQATNSSSNTPSTATSANGEKPVLEITAKFGMPSHLPPRPPPPQTMEPHKFHEINRGVGGLHAYPGMPRLPSNGYSGSSGPSIGRNNSSQS